MHAGFTLSDQTLSLGLVGPPLHAGISSAARGYTGGQINIYGIGCEIEGPNDGTPITTAQTKAMLELMRHFRDCILGKATPIIGAREGVQLMQMLDAIYRSSETGKSVEIR